MFKTKDSILSVFIFYSKGKGEKANPGGDTTESSAVAQRAISVFLSQKNKKFVRTLCP